MRGIVALPHPTILEPCAHQCAREHGNSFSNERRFMQDPVKTCVWLYYVVYRCIPPWLDSLAGALHLLTLFILLLSPKRMCAEQACVGESRAGEL